MAQSLIGLISLVLGLKQTLAANKSVISVFGSSVADGAFCSGNCSGRAFSPKTTPGGCYQSRLREYQAKVDRRSVFNNCHGGDTTTKLLARFDQMVSTKAGLVVIGLSLANEGLPYTRDYEKVFLHYEAGLRELVTKIRATGAEPLVASNYPNSGYNEEQYAYIKRINLLTQTWDLHTPQINFLGTIDDGRGRWVDGFHANGGHPNDLGSTEMYYAFVPSLFNAIQAGKPAVPERADGSQSVTLKHQSEKAVVQFEVRQEDVMHSFTLSFRVRCDGCSGLIAALDAEETVGPSPSPAHGCAPNWCKDHGYKEDQCNCGVCGSFGGCSFSCDPTQSKPWLPLHACNSSDSNSENNTFNVSLTTTESVDYMGRTASFPAFTSIGTTMTNRSLAIDSKNGQLTYLKRSSLAKSGPGPVVNDGSWHTILLTHYWCNGTTDLIVDGDFVSQSLEHLGPTRFQLRPEGLEPMSYQDLLIYRSGLNADEQQFLRDNKTHVLQASLEVYAPLDGKNPIENRAQSMSEIQIGVGDSETNLVFT